MLKQELEMKWLFGREIFELSDEMAIWEGDIWIVHIYLQMRGYL